jgi:hypothetical protein
MRRSAARPGVLKGTKLPVVNGIGGARLCGRAMALPRRGPLTTATASRALALADSPPGPETEWLVQSPESDDRAGRIPVCG